MSIGEVHHIGYLVKDIKKSSEVFMSLGYVATSDVFYDEERMSNFLFLKKQDVQVELIEPERESDLYGLLKTYNNVAYHICYIVDDIRATVDELQSKGFLLFRGRQNAPAISKNAEVVFLMHARMGIIELLQEV